MRMGSSTLSSEPRAMSHEPPMKPATMEPANREPTDSQRHPEEPTKATKKEPTNSSVMVREWVSRLLRDTSPSGHFTCQVQDAEEDGLH